MSLPPHILKQNHYFVQVKSRLIADVFSIEDHIKDDNIRTDVMPSDINLSPWTVADLVKAYRTSRGVFPYYFKCNIDTLAFFVQELKSKNLLICCHKKENSAYCYGNTCNVNDLKSY